MIQQIEDRIDIERSLDMLEPADREMMVLIFRLEIQPEDWGKRPWPAKYDDIGDYIGRKYEGSPLSEAAIRYRRQVVFQFWRGERGVLRRNRRKYDLLEGKSQS
jgi:hypothetical protein